MRNIFLTFLKVLLGLRSISVVTISTTVLSFTLIYLSCLDFGIFNRGQSLAFTCLTWASCTIWDLLTSSSLQFSQFWSMLVDLKVKRRSLLRKHSTWCLTLSHIHVAKLLFKIFCKLHISSWSRCQKLCRSPCPLSSQLPPYHRLSIHLPASCT